jgi:hypothetical protein
LVEPTHALYRGGSDGQAAAEARAAGHRAARGTGLGCCEELAIDIHIDKEITWYRLDDSRRDVQLDGTGNILTPELAKRKLNSFEARTGEGR